MVAIFTPSRKVEHAEILRGILRSPAVAIFTPSRKVEHHQLPRAVRERVIVAIFTPSRKVEHECCGYCPASAPSGRDLHPIAQGRALPEEELHGPGIVQVAIFTPSRKVEHGQHLNYSIFNKF